MKRYHSRKFLSAWGLTLLSALLLALGELESTDFASVMKIIWAAYFVAQAWQDGKLRQEGS